MTDIFIKSFNRPHYLDRCIFSIFKNVKGDFRVTVLDDGTPEKYLQKLKEKYPNVIFKLSSQAEQKRKAIEENLLTGSPISGFTIPILDWKEAVKSGTDYLIMTEDDVWITQEIDINKLKDYMLQYDMTLIKLGWISKTKISSSFHKLNSMLYGITPAVKLYPRWFMECYMRNKYKVFSIMYRLGMATHNSKKEYWVMNALLMGLYRKDYWLAVWSSLHTKVDETEQLINAASWYRKNKKANRFGKLTFDMMTTTFQSSATTSYHEHYKINLDINKLNHYLNEEWYCGNLNVYEDLPKDISVEKFKTILDKYNDSACTYENWMLWRNCFRQQYIRQNVEVD